jgi:hypothetical protein
VSAFSDADLAYLRANYMTLVELCAGRSETAEQVWVLIERGPLSRPSYVLRGGTGMFPADYFRLVDDAAGPEALREHFARRHRAASLAQDADPEALADDWEAYLGGVYGVCLREVTPETIVRKSVLVASVCQLLVLARPRSADWREALRAHVDELERESAPDYGRSAENERPPTRDLLVTAAHQRFPDVFAGAAATTSAVVAG